MFTLTFTDSALDDLRYFDKAKQTVIHRAIGEQLLTEPQVETRNRKSLRPNSLAEWEIRIGHFRVFYDVHEEDRAIIIKAIGWKEHNKLYLRGQEYKL